MSEVFPPELLATLQSEYGSVAKLPFTRTPGTRAIATAVAHTTEGVEVYEVPLVLLGEFRYGRKRWRVAKRIYGGVYAVSSDVQLDVWCSPEHWAVALWRYIPTVKRLAAVRVQKPVTSLSTTLRIAYDEDGVRAAAYEAHDGRGFVPVVEVFRKEWWEPLVSWGDFRGSAYYAVAFACAFIQSLRWDHARRPDMVRLFDHDAWVKNKEILFAGTRVPVAQVVEALDGGVAEDDVPDAFPGVQPYHLRLLRGYAIHRRVPK